MLKLKVILLHNLYFPLSVENKNVPKFRSGERTEIESIVASLTIKRIPDSLILKNILDTYRLEDENGAEITLDELTDRYFTRS